MADPHPVRLQLSRKAGFRLQEHSRAVNGLPAVNVARPSKWGNPFRVAKAVECAGVRVPGITPESAVALFRQRWEAALAQWPSARAALADLTGRNLACWCLLCDLHREGGRPIGSDCPHCDPCHADVLLELANAGGRADIPPPTPPRKGEGRDRRPET